MALITAVLLLLLISATVISSIEFSGQEYQAGGRARSTSKNLYAADSGIQVGLRRIGMSPRNLTALDFAMTDGTSVQSRARADAAPKDMKQVGSGKPPDGYGINVGAGYVNEIFQLNVTAAANNGANTELEAKLGSLAPNSGGY